MKLVINKSSKVNGQQVKIRNLKDGQFYETNTVFDTEALDNTEKARVLRLYKAGDLVEKQSKQHKNEEV